MFTSAKWIWRKDEAMADEHVDFVDKFPMNAAGKILKYKMRENAVEKLGLKKG